MSEEPCIGRIPDEHRKALDAGIRKIEALQPASEPREDAFNDFVEENCLELQGEPMCPHYEIGFDGGWEKATTAAEAEFAEYKTRISAADAITGPDNNFEVYSAYDDGANYMRERFRAALKLDKEKNDA